MPEPGLVHIYTGDGKGKTTAAMGLGVRALGHKLKIYILQFLKGRKTGEKIVLENLDNIKFERIAKSNRFFFQMNDQEQQQLIKETKIAWQNLENMIKDSEYDIIILDEIMAVIKNNIIELGDVISLIKHKSKETELILTGRDAPEELIELADYVTEMRMIKHPYTRKIQARQGIEY